MKSSMKRRRPWASPSAIVATTILLTAQLCPQTAGLPSFLENEPMLFAEGAVPEEINVESPTNAPSETSLPTLAPSKAPQTSATDSEGSIESVVKQSLDTSFDVQLNVTREVDVNQLLTNVRSVMEDYLFRRLSTLQEDNDLQIRKVTLAVSLVVRRFLLRRALQDRQSKDIIIEVDGSIQYDLRGGDITPERAQFLLEEELAELLEEDNLSNALQVEGILNVEETTILEDRDNNADNGGNSNTANNETDVLDARNDSSGEELERPSTLSIAFGFALTGIAFLGLVAYAYIFYRKRQKRLRRKKQMQESIQYRLPAPRVSPAKRSAPNTPQQTQVVAQRITPKGDEESSASSYKGLDSTSDEGPADSFARELQMAASLDEQAWEDFQRKKEALSRNDVVRATEVGETFGQYESGISTPTSSTGVSTSGGGSAWAKSFPYGDEQEVIEEGIEWTPDAANNWNAYDNNSPHATSRAEEKKDEWGSDQQETPASASTAAILESIQRDLATHGTNIDPEPAREDMTASDVVLEVERLSRYVKRYERRKERRAKREQDRSIRSSDASSTHGVSISSPTHSEPLASRSLRDSSISPRGMTPRSEPPISRPILEEPVPSKAAVLRREDPNHVDNIHGSYSVSQKENFQRQEQAPRITTYTGTFNQNESPFLPQHSHNPELASIISDYPDEVSEDTFDYTFQEQDQEGSLRSQRLGITPFKAEDKEEEPSFDYEAMSPMMQKLAKAEALRSSREDQSLPTDESITDRRRRTQSDGEAYGSRGGELSVSSLRGNHAMLDSRRPGRLSDLRDNAAIIDSSQSDVNVGFSPPPPEEGVEIPLSQAAEPKTPKKYKSGPSPSRKFNKLRNLFEERQNDAIFPPDQHWQYGVAK